MTRNSERHDWVLNRLLAPLSLGEELTQLGLWHRLRQGPSPLSPAAFPWLISQAPALSHVHVSTPRMTLLQSQTRILLKCPLLWKDYLSPSEVLAPRLRHRIWITNALFSKMFQSIPST